jgi:hypothetical protein
MQSDLTVSFGSLTNEKAATYLFVPFAKSVLGEVGVFLELMDCRFDRT